MVCLFEYFKEEIKETLPGPSILLAHVPSKPISSGMAAS